MISNQWQLNENHEKIVVRNIDEFNIRHDLPLESLPFIFFGAKIFLKNFFLFPEYDIKKKGGD